MFFLEEKVDVDDTADEVERSQNNSKDEMSQEVHFIQAPHRCERVVSVLIELTRFAQVMFQKLAWSVYADVFCILLIRTSELIQEISGVK